MEEVYEGIGFKIVGIRLRGYSYLQIKKREIGRFYDGIAAWFE